MPLFRVMVTIPHTNGSIADQCVNNWAFEGMGDAASTEALVTPLLRAFYESWAAYRAISMAWATTRSKGYNMGDPLPRAPLWDTSLGLGAGSSTGSLPHEVALCLSFQRSRGSGINMRRGRGRVYLGPFGTLANDSSSGRPSSTMRTAIRNAAQVLLDASSTSPGIDWVVMTQAAGPATSTPVHDGWIDDAWDTQRRRGIAPSLRSVYTLAA